MPVITQGLGGVRPALADGPATGGAPAVVSTRPNPRPSSEEYQRHLQYRWVLRAVDSGRWLQARREAQALGDPLFADYIDWLDYQRPLAGHGFRAIADFIDTHADWPKLGVLRVRAEEATRDAPDARGLLDWFERYPPLSAAGMIRRAEALLAVGETAKGRDAIRKTWREADFGRRQEHQFIRRHHDFWTIEDNIARLDRLLWEGKLTAARRVMGRVDDGHAALAEARRRLRVYRGGVDWAIKQAPPEMMSDPGLLYERLRWRRRKHRDAGAIEILDQAPSRPPYPELWWVERRAVARRVLASGKPGLAYRLASEHKQPPGTVGFAEAEWLAGWIALRFRNDGQGALDHFKRLYENVRFPVSRSRAAYWAGRAASVLRRDDEAEAWNLLGAQYPTTFHGQLASLNLEQTLRFDQPLPQPSEQRQAEMAEKPLARLAALLTRIGENGRIDPFMARLYQQARSPADKVLAARLAGDSSRFDLAAKYARDALRSRVNLIDYAYPVPLETGAIGGQEALVLAIIRQESGFDRNAQSHAGARGMMQIMPATAKKVARKLKLPYSVERLKHDLDYNLTLGQSYIEGLLERYDGSHVLALAAYNAGPARVKRWIKKNGDPRRAGVDSLDWIEKIPFRETRIYVQRVLSNLQVYRARLAPAQVALQLGRDLHLSR